MCMICVTILQILTSVLGSSDFLFIQGGGDSWLGYRRLWSFASWFQSQFWCTHWSCFSICTELSGGYVRGYVLFVEFLLPAPLWRLMWENSRRSSAGGSKCLRMMCRYVVCMWTKTRDLHSRVSSYVVHVWKANSRESPDPIMQTSFGVHVWKQRERTRENMLNRSFII